MSVAFCDFSELHEALARQDWQYLTVTDERLNGRALANIAWRSDAELRKLPNPHNLAWDYIRTTRRYLVTLYYDGDEKGEKQQISLAAGTPFVMVTKHRRQMREMLNKA